MQCRDILITIRKDKISSLIFKGICNSIAKWILRKIEAAEVWFWRRRIQQTVKKSKHRSNGGRGTNRVFGLWNKKTIDCLRYILRREGLDTLLLGEKWRLDKARGR